MGNTSVSEVREISNTNQQKPHRDTTKEPSYILTTCYHQIEFIRTVLAHDDVHLSDDDRYGMEITLGDINQKLNSLASRIPDGIVN